MRQDEKEARSVRVDFEFFRPSATPLDSAVVNRDSLMDAIELLEESLSRAQDLLRRPCTNVLAHLERAQSTFVEHCERTQDRDGLLGEVDSGHQELIPWAQQLRDEQERLQRHFDVLRNGLRQCMRQNLNGLEDACCQADQLLTAMRSYHVRRADLAFRAYIAETGMVD